MSDDHAQWHETAHAVYRLARILLRVPRPTPSTVEEDYFVDELAEGTGEIMKDRRTLSSSLSADVVQYLRRRRHSQAKIARLLGVSEAFVSLVKSRERSLTIDHLERLTDRLGIPLGAFLLAVTPLPKGATPEVKRCFDLSTKVIEAAQIARDAILRTGASARS